MDAGPGDDFFDVDTATYTSLDAVDPGLAERWRDHFLDVFFRVSELSESHRPEAKAMLNLQRGDAPGEGMLLLRIEFSFMGSTEWHEWDGTEAGAIEIAELTADTQGFTVGLDQRHGPTGWESEFDDDAASDR